MRSSISSWLRLTAAVALAASLGACAAHPGGLASSGAGISLARVALQSGDAGGALRLSSQVLTRHPGNPDALLVRGEALTRLGQLQAAGAAFTQVLNAKPNSEPALVGLGRLRLIDDPATATILFRHALAEAPGDGTALTDLGVALDLQGAHGPAQASYRLALAADPALTAARVDLALSLAQSGQGPAAVALMAPVARASSAGAKLREDYAAVLTMAGDRARARVILNGEMPPPEADAAMAAFAAGAASP